GGGGGGGGRRGCGGGIGVGRAVLGGGASGASPACCGLIFSVRTLRGATPPLSAGVITWFGPPGAGGSTGAGAGGGAAFWLSAGGTVRGGSGMVIGCSGGGPRRSFWLAEASLSPGLFALSLAVCTGVTLFGAPARVMTRASPPVNTARYATAPAVPTTASPTRAAAVTAQPRRGAGASS